jgi:hypothetical protein
MANNFKVFELADLARVIGMDLWLAKNWTVGRPLKIEASIRSTTGTGSRNLYSLEDVYRIALAYELRKAGMAAVAIGKALEATKAGLPKGLADLDWITLWRKPKAKGSDDAADFEVRKGQAPPPGGRLVWLTVNVGDLVARVNKRIEQEQ